MSTSTPTLNWGIVCTDRVRRSATARRCARHLALALRHRRSLDQREHVLLLDAPARAAAVDGREVDAVLLRELAGDRHGLLLRCRRFAGRLGGRDLLAGRADEREHLADRDRLARAVQHGEQRARDRGLDLERRLVGLDLEQRLALLDGRRPRP